MLTTMSRPSLTVHWPSQHWHKSNADLAHLIGCHENTVSQHRAVHAPHTTTPRGRPQVHDLSKADFTQHNADIAMIWGCHVGTVREWRRTHEVPACTKPARGSPGSPGRPRLYDHTLFDPRKTAVENASTMGCTYQLAWVMLRKHKKGKN